MMTYEELEEYGKQFGTDGMADLLLLSGPDNFAGDYNAVMATLKPEYLGAWEEKKSAMQNWDEFLDENYGITSSQYWGLGEYNRRIIDREYDEHIKHFAG